MSDTPEIIETETGLKCVTLENYRELERERDEAREDLEFRRGLYKVQEQCLETARRERDEAREERDNLKQELEIVTARLHGKKHPLDNGIPERREVYIFKNGKYELDT